MIFGSCARSQFPSIPFRLESLVWFPIDPMSFFSVIKPFHLARTLPIPSFAPSTFLPLAPCCSGLYCPPAAPSNLLLQTKEVKWTYSDLNLKSPHNSGLLIQVCVSPNPTYFFGKILSPNGNPFLVHIWSM